MASTELAVSVVLLAPLVWAVWIDQRYRRIPNWLCLGMAFSALLAHSVATGPVGALFAVAGFAVGLLIFLLPYALGGIAAGDVKLMAAVGACLGPGLAVVTACAALVVGSALGLTVMTYHYYRNSEPQHKDALTLRFPYASAIGIGAMVALFIRSGLGTN